MSLNEIIVAIEMLNIYLFTARPSKLFLIHWMVGLIFMYSMDVKNYYHIAFTLI